MLKLEHLTIEHQKHPIGIDCATPRFCWVLVSSTPDTVQTAYQILLKAENENTIDSGRIISDASTEVVVKDFFAQPKTTYTVQVTVWDNHNNTAQITDKFETGFLGSSWESQWLEPKQLPTEPSFDFDSEVKDTIIVTHSDPDRDFHEFRPVQYIRIPLPVEKGLKKARIYMTAHGVYQLELNGARVDDREFAPEISSYNTVLQYQTYDITSLLFEGKNMTGIKLGDGWWCGRVGGSGDSCQFGTTIGILFQAELLYEDGHRQIIDGSEGLSSTGPIIFSDIFVGERYDAQKEIPGWSTCDFNAENWTPLQVVSYDNSNLIGQYGEPVRPVRILHPLQILHTPKGETVLDVGQVLAGQLEIHLTTEAGHEIRMEHSEVLDENGNYYNNILGINKEQTDFYITKNGEQTYRPSFSYHGFRYVKLTGWPGEPSLDSFRIYALSSEMEDIGTFHTSNPKLNQLQSNIWWSQVSNTLAIPTDCPQRERAGWTGDIMAFAPTMAFNRQCDAFLTRWMASVRADQLSDGAVPMIVPYLKAYQNLGKAFGGETSCGWGDAVIIVPLAMYKAYGDTRILEENYPAMQKWLQYIENRAANHHPEGYATWSEERKERSRYLWNTDFHYGDWLVPSMVLGNPDGGAMVETAYKTKEIVAPAYFAFSARSIAEVADALGKTEDAAKYRKLYDHIKEAYIAEYIHEDGTISSDLQGIYIIALKNGLVPDEIKPKMIAHLRQLIKDNHGCLDTGFLSILFLMDVLCENNCRDVAYSLLYQNRCPSWLYEVEHGATTMWESWGAIGEDGKVSTYSYNHYAFGCVGEWLYREIGGIRAALPGYKKILISPAFDCGLDSASASEYTPYGKVSTKWEKMRDHILLHVEIPANTTAQIKLPNCEPITVGSGQYDYTLALSQRSL